MIDKNNQITRINDFSGGLNTKIKELNGMKPNETPHCMNVYADVDGALHKRLGRTKLNSVQVGAGSKDTNILFDANGTAFAIFGTSSYKMDELDGTWDSLDTGLTDCKWYGANYGGTMVIGSYNYAVPRSWDGSAATTTALTAAPLARYPAVWENYVWWWNVKNNTSRLQRSKYGETAEYDAVDYNDIITHDGDLGTGIGILKGILYCFKRWSIHRISYLGGVPLIDIRQMTNGVGTISYDTIKNITIPSKGEVLIFLGADKKLYIFDGYNATTISTKFEESNGISPIALETLNDGGLRFSHAVVDEVKHWYVLFVSNGGDSTITHGIVYNYHTGACWPFSGQALSSSAVVIGPVGKKWVIAGGYDGYAYRWNYGNTDDGTTVSAYHTIPRIFWQTPSALYKDRTVRIDLMSMSDDSISFQHRQDYGEDWSTAESIPLYSDSGEYYLGTTFALGTATLGPDQNVVHKVFDMPYLNNFIQFKISDSLTTNPWTVYSYDFVGKPIGYGEQ